MVADGRSQHQFTSKRYAFKTDGWLLVSEVDSLGLELMGSERQKFLVFSLSIPTFKGSKTLFPD